MAFSRSLTHSHSLTKAEAQPGDASNYGMAEVAYVHQVCHMMYGSKWRKPLCHLSWMSVPWTYLMLAQLGPPANITKAAVVTQTESSKDIRPTVILQ